MKDDGSSLQYLTTLNAPHHNPLYAPATNPMFSKNPSSLKYSAVPFAGIIADFADGSPSRIHNCPGGEGVVSPGRVGAFALFPLAVYAPWETNISGK